MGRVADKVALVTGGGAGIGRATALKLAGEGAAVAVTDRDEAAASATAEAIGAAGGKALAIRHDVTDETGWHRAVNETMSRYGKLDILINNAGVGTSKPLLDLSLAEWRSVLSVNLDGVFLGTRIGIEAMREAATRKRDRHGSIVNISSILGLVGLPECAAYSASKGAVRLFTKTVALESEALGWKVRVNSVHPGFIWTPMNEQSMKVLADRAGSDVATQRATIGALHPMNRFGEAEEVANGVLFLASDESSFRTGAELVLDGGYTAR
jgi:NAD(P)-dependent dehydrogenase (short-subunit alcohol dehydrogenase family)